MPHTWFSLGSCPSKLTSFCFNDSHDDGIAASFFIAAHMDYCIAWQRPSWNSWRQYRDAAGVMGCVKRIWYLSPMRAAKVQASLRIRAVSPEPPLLVHISSESREIFRQKASSLAPLNGWAFADKICHDGMLEDTNSLDAALMYFSKRVRWLNIRFVIPICQSHSTQPFIPFSIVITSLGEEGTGQCAPRAFVCLFCTC